MRFHRIENPHETFIASVLVMSPQYIPDPERVKVEDQSIIPS
jgi:hypothetical protein